MRARMTKNIISSVLLVMLFCYIPHLFSNPWWLSSIIMGIIVYRLISNHYAHPLPNGWVRFFLIIFCLFLLFWHYRLVQSSAFYIGFLLLFAALKSLEAHTNRDFRVLILCNIYVILTSLLLHQELWIFLYVILAAFASLAVMVKLAAPEMTFKPNGRRLIKHFFLAVPLSLLLFYLFPRLSHPLWRVPALSQTKTGFNEEMAITNLSEIFDNDSTAMRVVFNRKFLPTLYWRGLVLSAYNGLSWKPEPYDEHSFTPLPAIAVGASASYEVLLEPHQKKWLFYQDNPVASQPNLFFSSSAGLMPQDKSPIYQRFNYAIIDQPAVYRPLTKASFQQNTYLPPHGNPKLREWAKLQFKIVHGNVQALIDTIARHIHQQPYWYSLITDMPGIKVNLMDSFWFETKRGYCEYYTGAVAIILRAVGIPARVIIGYHGGKWNPVAQYLTVQQNDAHAWLEYWLDGVGWRRFDPVSFIAPERIDPTIHQKQADDNQQGWFNHWNQSGANLSWIMRTAFMLESIRFFWERWLLFYNQDTQRALLQKIGFDQWDDVNLLQAFVATIVFILAIAGIGYVIRQYRERDPLVVEYHRLQQVMRRLHVQTQPPATFAKQLHDLAASQPRLMPWLYECMEQYERIRLQHVDSTFAHRKAILQLVRSLRARLKTISTRNN